MVDNVAFYTNKDRKLGPFGGSGGDTNQVGPRGDPLSGYLCGFKGKVVTTQDELGIIHLAFLWVKHNKGGVAANQNPIEEEHDQFYYSEESEDDFVEDEFGVGDDW